MSMSFDQCQDFVHAEFKRLNAQLFGNRLPPAGPALTREPREVCHYAELRDLGAVKCIFVDGTIAGYAAVNEVFTKQFLSAIVMHEMIHLTARGKRGHDHALRFWWKALLLSGKLPGVRMPWPWECSSFPIRHRGAEFSADVDRLIAHLTWSARRRDVQISDPRVMRGIEFLDGLTGPQVKAAWSAVRTYMQGCGLLNEKVI